MCELFGVSSPEDIYLNELLREFFSHGTEHPHGWGLAFFCGNSVSVEKQPETSVKSTYLKQRLRANIKSGSMMAHIRLATKGSMEYENTHPFVRRDYSGRAWTLVHNGTIFESDLLTGYVRSQTGETDSERILWYLTDCIDRAAAGKGEELAAGERFEVVSRVVCELSPENKLNLLIYDGELLYAHTNCRNSLYRSRWGGGTIISTRPLGQGTWESLPMNTLVAFKDGRNVYTGDPHGHEFKEDPEKMRLLFLDYAAL